MRFLAFILVFFAAPAFPLTPEAKEFIEISRKLEPVQCQKRQLRRQITLAEAEQRGADAKALKEKFAALNRNVETARLERRLAELAKRISDGKGGTRDPEDLQAISFQHREAFYRCE